MCCTTKWAHLLYTGQSGLNMSQLSEAGIKHQLNKNTETKCCICNVLVTSSDKKEIKENSGRNW